MPFLECRAGFVGTAQGRVLGSPPEFVWELAHWANYEEPPVGTDVPAENEEAIHTRLEKVRDVRPH